MTFLISKLDIYNYAAKPFIPGLLEGYNFTVFAYGCTGAGKTYTMVGPESNPGIMKNTIEDLFTQLDNIKKDYEVAVYISYIEVYNEVIRDL